MSECVITTLHGSFCFERFEASTSKVHVFEQQHYNSIIYPRDVKLRPHKAGWLKDHLAMQPRFGKTEPLFSKNVYIYIINYLFTKDNTGAS